MKTEMNQSKGTVEMVISMIIFGFIGVAVNNSHASPMVVVFARTLIAAILLGIYCFVRGHFKGLVLTKRIVLLLILNSIATAITWICLFSSYQRTSIAVATALYHTQPFFLLILVSIIDKERIKLVKWMWIAFAFLGVMLVAGIIEDSSELTTSYLIGVAEVLIGAVFYAFIPIITRHLTTIRKELLTFFQCLFIAIGMFPLVKAWNLPLDRTLNWGWLFLIGAFFTAFTYIVMYDAYRNLASTMIAVLVFIYPVSAMIVDHVFYHVRISIFQILGVVIIIIASLAITLNWGDKKKRIIKEDILPVD